MLVNNINSKLLRDIETDIATAEANGGFLKPAPAAEGEASAANPTPAAMPAKAEPPAPAPTT
jgi:hypothetical protein